jgi:hypothetical protein
MGGEIRNIGIYDRQDLQKTNPGPERLHEEVYKKEESNLLRDLTQKQNANNNELKGFPAAWQVFNFIEEQSSNAKRMLLQDKLIADSPAPLAIPQDSLPPAARKSAADTTDEPDQLHFDYDSEGFED